METDNQLLESYATRGCGKRLSRAELNDSMNLRLFGRPPRTRGNAAASRKMWLKPFSLNWPGAPTN